MDKERKYFADNSGRLNSDDSPFVIGTNEWVNGENIRTGTTDAGVTGVVESIGSTELISTPQPSVTFLEIGSTEDTENNRFCYFKFNTTGTEHKIVTYYANTNTEYDTLLSSQVDGGLNFDKNSIIHSAKIINGMLYWVDSDNNQPRKINIESAIKANYPSFSTDAVAYSFPIDFKEITLIKPPPPLAPNILKSTDGGFDNNFIANESFEFSFQYIWYDNETTVVGTYSPASRLNFTTDTYNRIIVTMDILEDIPDTVRIVNLVVRLSNTNFSKVIKSWDKDVASEAAEIVLQNSQTTPLTFNFYNNSTGQFLAEDDTLRPFDNVPIFSETMEAAKNRVHLANNTEGYDTPKTTSLAIALGNELDLNEDSTLNALISFRFTTRTTLFSFHSYSAWYVYMTSIYPNGYYLASTPNTNNSATYPAMPTTPTTIAESGLVYKGATETEVINTEKVSGSTYVNKSVTITGDVITITGSFQNTYNVITQKSPFRAGVVFYDFAMRKCGVVTNDGIVVSTPTRNFDYDTAVSQINWTLDNANALNEIPDWAYYYAVVWTLNQRTRFFIQSFSNTNKYATKDTNGLYVFDNDLYVSSAVGIGIDTTALYQSGLGYVYTEGDICILIKSDNTVYELPIIGQQDNYIIIKAQDIGTLASTSFVYEIYTPYQTSEQEPYFEMGEMNRIINPTTVNRQYENLFGFLNADSYALTRNYNTTTYFAGAMSPNDLFYKRWDTDSGKVNFITKLGQVVKTQYGSFSDTFIPNTAINGLSTFRLGNQYNVPEDCGSITKLQLTSKVQSEGTVMLAICKIETNSLYLGEVQITDSTGKTQFFSQSSDVVGTINTLKGNFGCINAESVIQYRGNVYFFDANNGRIVQYSANGLFPISDYKMARFWKLFSLQYLSMTTAEIEALGSRPFIFSAVDAGHNEVLFSIPKLLETPPKGYLPDYPSTVYPFDIYDGRGKTIVYNLGNSYQEPHWQGAFSFNPEGFVTLQNRLYSFKYGSLYLHNSLTSQNNFYGVQYTSKIMFVSNQIPNLPKVYENILSESNIVPFFVYFYNDYPVQQSSDLVDLDFRELEGIFYSTILRNKLVPTATGYTTNGLLTGEKMRNVAMMIMFEFSPTTNPLALKFIEIGINTSRGHRV